MTVVSIFFGTGCRISDQTGGHVNPDTCEMCLLIPSLLPFPHLDVISSHSTYKIHSPRIYVGWPLYTLAGENHYMQVASQNSKLVDIPRAQTHFRMWWSLARKLPQLDEPFPRQAVMVFNLTAILRLPLDLTVIAVLG